MTSAHEGGAFTYIPSIDLCRILAVAFSLPFVMVVAAPVIAVTRHYVGVSPAEAHARLMAAMTESAWHQVTSQPLRFVGCGKRLHRTEQSLSSSRDLWRTGLPP
jgi:hypothetical protein